MYYIVHVHITIAKLSEMSRFLWCSLLAVVFGAAYGLRMAPLARGKLLQAQIERDARLRMTENGDNRNKKRRIIRYDNVGDPVYEGEEPESLVVAGFDLGISLDPTSATLLIFGLIAFNFLVLANADIPQFNFRF